MSPYRTGQEPLRQKRYQGVVADLSKIRDRERGDVATLAWPERGTWIFDGTMWRRMKMLNEPEPEDPRAAALRRLKTPLRLETWHGNGHSEKTLNQIVNPERGDYATGPGAIKWVYDGVAWRRLKKNGKL